MSEARTLTKETEAAKALIANMADVIGDDAELLSDTIEGETSLFEAISRAVNRINELGTLIASLGEYEKSMSARKSRLKQQADVLRTSVAVAMSVAGHKTMELPMATISRKHVPPGISITDEADIPPKFWIAGNPRLDRKALLEALRDGKSVAGAQLGNGGETLAIRSK